MTTQAELRYYCEQIITACILYRLLKIERNVAAKLLLKDIRARELGRHVCEINEDFDRRPPLPLDEISWFAGGIAKGAKLKGELV
jgi:hypothetical protein